MIHEAFFITVGIEFARYSQFGRNDYEENNRILDGSLPNLSGDESFLGNNNLCRYQAFKGTKDSRKEETRLSGRREATQRPEQRFA